MNKLLKGSIAGGAGVALLLGGAGTFALWNDNATIMGGTITAGDLDVSTAEGVWADQFGTIASIDEYLIVPGDTLTYKTTVTVEATGDNLSAELSVGDRTMSPAAGSQGAALVSMLHESTTLEVVEDGVMLKGGGPGHGGPGHGGPGNGDSDDDGPIGGGGGGEGDETSGPAVLTITPDDGSHTYEVTVTIEFPSGDLGAENAAKNGQVSLNNFGITLNQVLLPVPAA